MTILPKKKASKEKQATQQHDSSSESDHEGAHSDPVAAGGCSPPPESEEGGGGGEEVGEVEGQSPSYHHHYHTPPDYYQRHYSSSGESSPELPVLSKSRGFRPPGAQARPKAQPLPASPTDSDSAYYAGYNSSEEYEKEGGAYFDKEKERLFEEALKNERRFIIKRMRTDGACLFRAVADQVYGDQEMHSVVRHHCMDYMFKNMDYFSQYVTEDFKQYINRKRSDHCYGNNLEMQAIAEMYNRTIEVFQYGTEPINIFFGVYKTDNAPIRLSYHGGIHYNSVVDPFNATVGVGLGLAGHKPGFADKQLMSTAKRESEMNYIEQTMLEDKLRNSDWEYTCEAIEQAVARESYLQWLKEQDQRAGNSSSSDSGPSHQAQSNPSYRPWSSALPAPFPPPPPFTSSIGITLAPSTLTSTITTTTTSTTTTRGTMITPKLLLRARSRSRSSSRSHSPAVSSPAASRNTSSPHNSGRVSPRVSARNSPRGSARTSPVGSPCGSSPGSRRGSPIHNAPANSTVQRSPQVSPVLRKSFSLPSPNHSSSAANSNSPPPPLPPPLPQHTYGATQAHVPSLDSHAPHSPSPSSSLDFESGKVLSQMPFEYSSFLDLPPSSFGLSEWEDDRVLAAVLAASQQEYIDGLKKNTTRSSLESQ